MLVFALLKTNRNISFFSSFSHYKFRMGFPHCVLKLKRCLMHCYQHCALYFSPLFPYKSIFKLYPRPEFSKFFFVYYKYFLVQKQNVIYFFVLFGIGEILQHVIKYKKTRKLQKSVIDCDKHLTKQLFKYSTSESALQISTSLKLFVQ